MGKHIILIIHVINRTRHVMRIQEVLTKYGCLIRTRLGLHEVESGSCSPDGLIVLELLDNETEAEKLKEALEEIEGIEAKKLIFAHQRD